MLFNKGLVLSVSARIFPRKRWQRQPERLVCLSAWPCLAEVAANLKLRRRHEKITPVTRNP